MAFCAKAFYRAVRKPHYHTSLRISPCASQNIITLQNRKSISYVFRESQTLPQLQRHYQNTVTFLLPDIERSTERGRKPHYHTNLHTSPSKCMHLGSLSIRVGSLFTCNPITISLKQTGFAYSGSTGGKHGQSSTALFSSPYKIQSRYH